MIDDALTRRHPVDIYAPQAHFKDFDEEDIDNKILQHLIISEKNLSEDDMMIEVVKEFCLPLQFNDPKRLEKFLQILNPVQCFDFILLFPKGTFDSSSLSI